MSDFKPTRRQLITSFGVLAGAGALGLGGLLLRPKKLGSPSTWLVGSWVDGLTDFLARVEHYDGRAPLKSGYLTLYEIETGRIEKIAVPFFAHSVASSPKNPRIGYAIGRWTSAAALIDFESLRVTKDLPAREGFRYFGHGLFMESEDAFFLSANSDDHKEGCVFLHSSLTGKIEDKISLDGIFPHDCAWVERDRILAVACNYSRTHGETPGCVSLVDVRSRKVVHKVEVPYATHLHHVEKSTWLVAARKVKATDMSLVQVDLNSGRVLSLSDEYVKRGVPSKGEALSFGAVQENWVFTTTGDGQRFLVVNSKTDERLDFDFARPTSGLSVHGERIFVNSWTPAGPLFEFAFDSKSKKMGREKLLSQSFSNGSHLSMIRI